MIENITDILNAVTLILIILWLILIILWLIRIDKRVGTNTQPIQKSPSKPLFKPKETPETAEEKRQRILSENIDNYNGTKEGQTRI